MRLRSASPWARPSSRGVPRHSTLSNSSKVTNDSVSDARHFDHAVHLGQRLHHALQLTQIATVEGEHVARAAVVAGATVAFADVDALGAERLADHRQNSGLVRGRDAQLHRAVDLRARIPLHVDPALRLGVEPLLALAPVHGDAAAAGDEADDGVTRQRVTALRVAHEHVVDAADLDAGRVAAGDLAHQLLDPARAEPLGDRRGLRVPVGLDHRHDLLASDLAVAHLQQHLVPVRVVQLGQDAAHLGLALRELGVAHPGLAEARFEQLAAEVDALLTLLGAQRGADPRARAGGDAEVEPVLRRLLGRRGHDLDDVAALQLVADRHDLPVGAGADTVRADLGVDGVGEVDRGRAAREHVNVTLRGEDVDLVREQVDLHALDELDRVLQVALELGQLAQPLELLGVLRVEAARAALLVLPVRRDAVLGDAVHLVGADLDFDALPTGPDQRRVQRLIHIGLRQRDVVLETPRDRRPARVHRPERRVTFGRGLDADSERQDVEHLLELRALLLHLAEDR